MVEQDITSFNDVIEVLKKVRATSDEEASLTRWVIQFYLISFMELIRCLVATIASFNFFMASLFKVLSAVFYHRRSYTGGVVPMLVTC